MQKITSLAVISLLLSGITFLSGITSVDANTRPQCGPSNHCNASAPCCSKWGYCGSGSGYCGNGCRPSSSFSPSSCLSYGGNVAGGTTGWGRCSASSPCASPDAPCCSKWGYCGKTSDFCGKGCNSLASLSGSCSGSAAGGAVAGGNSGSGNTQWGQCSASSPCTSASAPCCSKWGYCGSGPAFCGNGCKTSASKNAACSSNATNSSNGNGNSGGTVAGGNENGHHSGSHNNSNSTGNLGGFCSSTNPCPAGYCCSFHGYCGKTYAYCGTGCNAAASGSDSCLAKVTNARCESFAIDFTAAPAIPFYYIGNVTTINSLPVNGWLDYNPSALAYTADGLRMRMQRSAEKGPDGRWFGVEAKIASIAYLLYGRVEAVLKAAPGKGVVTGLLLQSDYIDEIDWEWLGGKSNEVQSNLFYNGVLNFKNAKWHAVGGTNHTQAFHNYTIVWNKEETKWYIDSKVVRKAKRTSFTRPMRVYVGVWDGGAQAPGTRDWAGGYVHWDKFNYTDAYVKSFKLSCA